MRSKVQYYFVKAIYVSIDILLVSLAILLTCYIRQTTLPFEISFYNIFLNPENPFRIVFVLWIISILMYANSNSLYQTKREIGEGFELSLIFKTIFMSALIIIVAGYALKINHFPRTIVLIGSIINIILLTVWRIIKRIYVRYLISKGYNNFNALVIGAGKVGRTLAMEVEKLPELGIKIAGYLDDHKTKENIDATHKILGKLTSFKRIAHNEFIDMVFITIHPNSDVFFKLLEEAKEMGISIRVIPQGFDIMSGECTKFNIGIIPIIEYCDVIPFRNQIGKRLFDFTASLFGIICVLPVLIIVGILIKIDSRGPILYYSKRYGRNGKVFSMIKFRSMSFDSDKLQDKLGADNEKDGPIFKIKKDPRITKVGKLIRKFSLDELPQLFNVLKGEMSLVGPRPLPIDQIVREDLKQLRRLQVRPGITGLWQVRGRSDVSFRRLIRWDIWYINNWSFWLDLNILFRTIPVVLKAKGAY